MPPLKPFKALKKGDLIGVIAPAAAPERTRFENGLECLRSYGFNIKVALDPSAAYGSDRHLFSSDTAARRSAAFLELFKDNKVRAIISARGAYGSMEMLPHIKWSTLHNHTKPFIGFSDITALLNCLVLKSRIIAIHGPSIESAFSKSAINDEARRSADALVRFLTQGTMAISSAVELTRLCGKGIAEGQLIGGNLSVVNALVGTPWQLSLRGKVLFLEECGEKPYRIHRMLLQMKLAGAFKGLRGVVLGSFTNCNHPQGLGASLDAAICDIFEEYRFPVVSGLHAGHSDLNLPVPLGLKVKLSVNHLEFKERAVLS